MGAAAEGYWKKYKGEKWSFIGSEWEYGKGL